MRGQAVCYRLRCVKGKRVLKHPAQPLHTACCGGASTCCKQHTVASPPLPLPAIAQSHTCPAAPGTADLTAARAAVAAGRQLALHQAVPCRVGET